MPAARIASAASEHRVVQRPGALRTAGDQQHRQVGPEPEVGPGLVGQRQPVQAGDLPAQRDAHVTRVRQLSVGLAGEDMPGEPRANAVGQPGTGVRLVHHDRHVTAARGQVGRGGHVPAEADQHLGPGLVQHPPGRRHRGVQPPRHTHQFRGDLARQGHRRDQRELISAHRDQPGLQPALGAQAHDAELRVGPAQRIGQGQCGLDMTGCATTREYDAHGPALPPSLTAPGPGWRFAPAGQAKPA